MTDQDTMISSADLQISYYLEVLTQPIESFASTSTNQVDILNDHLHHHFSEMISLFLIWIRAYPFIEQSAMDEKGEKTLQSYFIQRFHSIIQAHIQSAQTQSVQLPETKYLSALNLDKLDLLILWFLTAHVLSPDFKSVLKSYGYFDISEGITTDVMLQMLCDDLHDRMNLLKHLAPSSPLSRFGFILPSDHTHLQNKGSWKLSEQLLYQFTGILSLSSLSSQFAELLFPNLSENIYLSECHLKTLNIIRNYSQRPVLNTLSNLTQDNLNIIPSMAFLIEGLYGSGRSTLVRYVASQLHLSVILIQSTHFEHLNFFDLDNALSTIFHDARMLNACLCFKDADSMVTDPHQSSLLNKYLTRFPVICALCVDPSTKPSEILESCISFKTRITSSAKDSAIPIWKSHLDIPGLKTSDIRLSELSERVALQPIQIQKSAKLAYYATSSTTDEQLSICNHDLEKAAAIQVTKNIGHLAFVTEPEISMEDVIVSDELMAKLNQIIGSARNRKRVLEEWGLSKRIRRGTGIISLFDGDPGTGKTHCAEAIAHELGLSLLRVNIASMVDKYIGETEKNLTTIFEQSRPDMQLLLFDEADSLFTKRTSNVEKSNDRYANMGVNVLLQLVERYEGISILTTNLKNTLDPAFERRMTYKVYFPMPKQAERLRLWQYMCPPEIQTSEPIDYEYLSEIELSGGEIKNAILTAAFHAATNGVLLNNALLYEAGINEAVSAGRVIRRYQE